MKQQNLELMYFINFIFQLLDLLDKEKGLKASRDTAEEYLESISKNYDGTQDEKIEKKISSILSSQEKALEQLDTHVNELKQKEAELAQDVNIKRLELERAEKRLESLHNAKPQHLQEITQYEHDLSEIFKLYVEKLRNHDYLQSRVDKYQKLEEINKKNLKVLIDQNKRNEQKYIHDDNDLVDDNINDYEEEDNRENPSGPLQGEDDGIEGIVDGNDDELEDDEHF